MGPSASKSSEQPNVLPDQANIIIVGGGLVGLEIAKELDRLGKPGVLVLEAGPAEELSHINAVNDADTALRCWLDPAADKYFWRPWISESEPHYAGIAGLKRRLGGRSLCWHGVVLPIEKWALTAPWWPREVVDDLTHSWLGGASLYKQVSAELTAWQAAGGIDQDAELPPLRVGNYRFSMTPQAVRDVSSTRSRYWEAYSPLAYWKRQGTPEVGGVLRTPHTLIIPRVEVLSIRLEEGRVSSVQARHGSNQFVEDIRCSVVVLAAGTIESTRLAIQALSEVAPPNNMQLDGLVDHIVQGFVATLDPAAVPSDLSSLAVREPFYFAPCEDRSRSNLFVRVYSNEVGALVVDVWTMGEQLPSSHGVVQCVPSSEFPWKTLVHAGLTNSDWEVIHQQRSELQAFWTAFCNLIGRAGSTLEFPDFTTAERTLSDVLPGLATAKPASEPITWTGPLGSEYHEGCTLPIGRLLDSAHEFMAVKGLFAGGPCTFPRMGAANPSLTSLALARRLAAFLPG